MPERRIKKAQTHTTDLVIEWPFGFQTGNQKVVQLTKPFNDIRLHVTIEIPDKSVIPDPHFSTEDAI